MLLVVSAGVAAAEDVPAHACRRDTSTIVCNDGRRLLRVIRGSVSPSKRCAIAWGFPAGDPAYNAVHDHDSVPEDALAPPIERGAKIADEDDWDKVVNVLIRLSDGHVLQTLDAHYFSDNPSYPRPGLLLRHDAHWSKDGHFLVQAQHSRFSTEFASVYRINQTDRVIGPLRLAAPCGEALCHEFYYQAAIRLLKQSDPRFDC